MYIIFKSFLPRPAAYSIFLYICTKPAGLKPAVFELKGREFMKLIIAGIVLSALILLGISSTGLIEKLAARSSSVAAANAPKSEQTALTAYRSMLKEIQ
jgi:hypothetical protein